MNSTAIDFYAARVHDLAVRRRLMEQAIDYAAACGNGHETSELVAIGAKLYRTCLGIDAQAAARSATTGDLMAAISVDVKSERGRRVQTYLPALDNRTRGTAPGEVLTIVARPQVGKSALASQIAVNAARSGERVVFFSLEMPREQALTRMIQQVLGLTLDEVERLARDDWPLTSEQTARLAPVKERVQIIDRGKSGIDHLDAAMLEADARLCGKPRLAVIDYLGLLSSGSKNLPLYQRVSEAAVDVKSFAKRHGCAVVLLSQAGREQDQDKTEGAEALALDAARDSGQVEEAADFLACLWRPWLSSRLKSMEERAEVRGQLYVRLLKNRRGDLGTNRLHFDHDTLQISDWRDA